MGFGFNFIYIVLTILVVVILLAIFVLLKYSKKKKVLDKIKLEDFYKKMRQIKSNISTKEQIIDYDKLYHKILQELGYSGDFGNILKQNPSVISDINKVWELHKLRNKLVHDFDLVIESVLKKKALQYEELIKDLLK